jgi:hypothetical protein
MKMPAGYSKRSLVEKLGIRANSTLAILSPPEGYSKTLGKLPAGVRPSGQLRGKFNLIHFFTKKRDDLDGEFASLKQALHPNGALWISWPKGSSRVPTDVSENVVREIALSNGLVDIKVCAVDEVWSGLKLVYRLKDRKKPPKPAVKGGGSRPK